MKWEQKWYVSLLDRSLKSQWAIHYGLSPLTLWPEISDIEDLSTWVSDWGYDGEKLSTSFSLHTPRPTCHENKNIKRRWCCLWLKHNHGEWLVSSLLKLILIKMTLCVREHLNAGMFCTHTKKEICKLSKYICLSLWQLQSGTLWKLTMWKHSGHGNPLPGPLTTGSLSDQGPHGYIEIFQHLPQAPHSQR